MYIKTEEEEKESVHSLQLYSSQSVHLQW